MSNRKALYREVYRLIQESLCSQGMQKRTQGFFTRPLAENVIGAVGLNAATKHDFHINPLIGIRHQSLEQLLAQLEGREFHPYVAPTIATPIGYLIDPPEYREWPFEVGKDNATMVAAMVHEITTVGFRYMEANQTIEAMCERIVKDQHFMMHSDVYQLPVGYLMLGRYEEAEEVVRRELEKIAAHKPPTVEELEAEWGEKLTSREIEELEKNRDKPISYPYGVAYRRFAERFFEKLEAARRGVDPLESLRP